MSARPFAPSGGMRVTLCRSLATLKTCSERTPWWEVEAFERELLALELDFLSSKQAVQKLKLRPGPVEIVGEGGKP